MSPESISDSTVSTNEIVSKPVINLESAESKTAKEGEIKQPDLATGPVACIGDPRLVGFEQVDPKFITSERISGWIGWAVVTGGMAVGLLIAFFARTEVSIWFVLILVVCVIISAILAWAAQVLPRWQYEATGWRLDESGLMIRTGVFWRKVVTVPRARVQHADVHQGPLLRYLSLAKLIVHTAGTQNASVELPGLNKSVAEKLRDALVADRGLNDAV